MTAIIFLIVLAVLVFVHELGHFLAARAAGIRVDAFAIGFGPKIFSWKRGETTYSVNWIPFGGYVKIFGENPDAESMTGPDSSRSFARKPRYTQAMVLAAGVLFNFLFAWVLYSSLFTVGVTSTIDGFEKYADHFTDHRVMIVDVIAGSPAEKAGIKIGDVVAGNATFKETQALINASAGKEIKLDYVRNGEPHSATVTPVQGIVEEKYAIGIAMNDVADLHLPIHLAVWEGGHYTLVMMRETATGLYVFLADIFRGQADLSEVSGPVGIAGIVGGAASMGFTYLLMVTALISINLGIINLVPFPALDGGRILFTAIEAVTRRRIPAKFTNYVNGAGFVALIALMILVTYKDILGLVG